MELEDLGYNKDYYEPAKMQVSGETEVGRVVMEHRERYVVQTAKGEYEAEITGAMRYTSQNRESFPAVGDWVLLTVYDNDFAIIRHILPRQSVISRNAVGKKGEVQVIAANIDYAFLMQAVDRDFNINRLDRYLAVCSSSAIQPVIVLTKTDMSDGQEISEMKSQLKKRLPDVPVIPLSNITMDGYDDLRQFLRKGKTCCLLGSSGIGKSTLINNLSGRPVMKTGAVSSSTSKGRHVTSHRELIVLESGGILIDNPGMREVGVTDMEGGSVQAFNRFLELSQKCRYNDCTHTSEKGCAIIEALEKGQLDENAYENYLKLEREKAYFETSVAERRKKEKRFGKSI